jgi:hypothetical protein
MEGNDLARKGLKKVGVYPFNPNWAEQNAGALKPSEAYKTNGDQAEMGRICLDMPEVHTLTDAKHILTAKRSLEAMRSDPSGSEECLKRLGTTFEDAEHLFTSVKLAKYSNNPLQNIMQHPWWKKSLVNINEFVAPDARGTHYESRAAGMILNDEPRMQLLEEERRELEEFQKELIMRERLDGQRLLAGTMLAIGGYLDPGFDPDDDTIKADAIKRFIRNNNLHRREDYAAACARCEPPRDAAKGLLQSASVQYLRQTIELNDSLPVDSPDKIQWQ